MATWNTKTCNFASASPSSSARSSCAENPSLSHIPGFQSSVSNSSSRTQSFSYSYFHFFSNYLNSLSQFHFWVCLKTAQKRFDSPGEPQKPQTIWNHSAIPVGKTYPSFFFLSGFDFPGISNFGSSSCCNGLLELRFLFIETSLRHIKNVVNQVVLDFWSRRIRKKQSKNRGCVFLKDIWSFSYTWQS